MSEQVVALSTEWVVERVPEKRIEWILERDLEALEWRF